MNNLLINQECVIHTELLFESLTLKNADSFLLSKVLKEGFGFKPVSNPSEMIGKPLHTCLAGVVHNFMGRRLLAIYMNSVYVTRTQSVYLSENRSLGK